MKFYNGVNNSIVLNKITGNFWETAKIPLIILGIIVLFCIVLGVGTVIYNKLNREDPTDGEALIFFVIFPTLFIAVIDLLVIMGMFLATSVPTFHDSMKDIAPKYNMTIVNSDSKDNLYYLEENSTHKYYKNCFIKNSAIGKNKEKVQLICDTSGGVSEMVLRK